MLGNTSASLGDTIEVTQGTALQITPRRLHSNHNRTPQMKSAKEDSRCWMFRENEISAAGGSRCCGGQSCMLLEVVRNLYAVKS